MKPRLLKIRRWLAGAVFLGLLLFVVLVACSHNLLGVTSPLQNSDAIVVLGGEPAVRAEHAARLAVKEMAPLLIVSGFGDCEDMRGVLARHGVRTNLVELECSSTSTRQNALFTARLLRAHGCQRVILVRTWLHSRRALSCFRKYAPEMVFLSSPASRTKPWHEERSYIAAEYLKTVGYALRFGISPTGAGCRGKGENVHFGCRSGGLQALAALSHQKCHGRPDPIGTESIDGAEMDHKWCRNQ